MTHQWCLARRIGTLWAVAFLLIVSACTGDELPVAAPVDVETCDELVDISVQLVEVWVDVLNEVPIDELLTGEPPPEFVELAEIGVDLDERASRLDCDPQQMNDEVLAQLAENDMDTEGAVADLLLEIVQGGVVTDLPPAPPTTQASP